MALLSLLMLLLLLPLLMALYDYMLIKDTLLRVVCRCKNRTPATCAKRHQREVLKLHLDFHHRGHCERS